MVITKSKQKKSKTTLYSDFLCMRTHSTQRQVDDTKSLTVNTRKAETLGLKMGSNTPTTHQMYEWNYFIITEETILQVNVIKWPQKMLGDTEE